MNAFSSEITLIPLLSRFEKEDDDKLNSYFLSLLNGLTVIFLSISILGFIFRYEIADIFGVVNQELFVKVFTPIIFSQVFFFSGAIMMAYQYFKNEFKYAAIAPVIYNLSIILFGWIYSSTPEATVYGFALGGLIGSFLGHIVIQLIGLRSVGLSYKFIKPKAMFLSQYFKVSLPLIVGQSIAVMDEQLFRIFGSFLSIGAIASFRYARRVAILPVGVIAQAVGVASFPTLSNLFVNKKFEELRELIRRQVSILFFLNVAIVLFFFFGSDEIKERKNGQLAVKIGTTLDNSEVTTWLYLETQDTRKKKLNDRIRKGRAICVQGYFREYRKEGDTSPYRAIVASDFTTRKDQRQTGRRPETNGSAAGYAEVDPTPDY